MEEIKFYPRYLEDISNSTNTSYFLTYTATYWTWLLTSPIIIVLGTFGNVMIYVILRRLEFSASNVFFISLAISDIFVLYTGLFPEWIEIAFQISFRNWHAVSCKLFFFLSYTTGGISAYLLVAMTVHRAISIVRPHHVTVVNTGRKASFMALGIVGVIFLYYSHMLYGFDLKSVSNDTSPICTPVSEEYNSFLGKVWSWIDLLVGAVLPFILLLISNGVLVRKIRSSAKFTRQLMVPSHQCERRQKRTSTLTVTLIAVSMAFLVLTSPTSIYHILRFYVYDENYHTQTDLRTSLALFQCVSFLLWFCNSAVNFYIYCLTGTKFREELKNILTGCNGKSA